MFTIVGRSVALSPYLKASSQAIASQVKPLVPPVSIAVDIPNIPPPPSVLTKEKLSTTIPVRSRISVSSGIGVPQSVRYAHTDIRIPDFTDYRRPSTKDPKKSTRDGQSTRQAFTYLIVAGGGVMTAYTAKAAVNTFVMSMAASADVLALTKIEIKLSDVPEGKNVTFKWRGKPLFVKHRTAEEIKVEQSVDISTLRDPQDDSDRVQKPEWLILIGVCTHLGCVPIADAGDYGGYYCPCHGSHYDGSGRIRKGPAPLNLEIPYYEFVDENTLLVG